MPQTEDGVPIVPWMTVHRIVVERLSQRCRRLRVVRTVALPGCRGVNCYARREFAYHRITGIVR